MVTGDAYFGPMGPPNPIPWVRFRAEIEAVYPGPPVCSKGHAGVVRWVLDRVQALDLAGDGDPSRHISTTADLTLGVVSAFRAALDPEYSAWTIRGRMAILRTICIIAEAHRWVACSPFRLKRFARIAHAGPMPEHRALTLDEIRRLFDRMILDIEERQGWARFRARRLYAVTSLIAYCGLRRSEALLLHVEDLDLAGGVVDLSRTGTKTARSSECVPIPPALTPILSDWLAHRLDRPRGFPMPPAEEIPWLFPTVGRRAAWISGSPHSRAIKRLQSVAARVGIHDITWQMLRRSWATHAEAFGVPPAMIERVLRHVDGRTTRKHYRKADIANMKEAVKDVRF